MTILGPVLMALVFIVPVYFAEMEGEIKKIGVIDETGLFVKDFDNSENLTFSILQTDIESAKNSMVTDGYYALLHIPRTELSIPQTAVIYSPKQPNIVVKSYIKNAMRKKVESLKLQASGIDPAILTSIKSNVNLLTVKMNDGGQEENTSTELSMAIGFVGGLLIYIFIFMYGGLVMRGVIEEKTNRIIEIIVSSVKPFQLMMGKIVGVAMVGLTQFVLWILLTMTIVTIFMSVYATDLGKYQSGKMKLQEQAIVPQEPSTIENNNDINESVVAIFESIRSINFGVLIFAFLFYFIGGYLLYGALFAAIGSAVDNETDTQQFMLPLTIPMIISIALAQSIMVNPDGPAAYWLSLFPLTSPVIMMIRIPFGVPYTDLVISMALLILGFLGATWLAGKIYRTGILMYGKKVSYKEIWKWIKYQ